MPFRDIYALIGGVRVKATEKGTVRAKLAADSAGGVKVKIALFSRATGVEIRKHFCSNLKEV